jgi:hypothetical protein
VPLAAQARMSSPRACVGEWTWARDLPLTQLEGELFEFRRLTPTPRDWLNRRDLVQQETSLLFFRALVSRYCVRSCFGSTRGSGEPRLNTVGIVSWDSASTAAGEAFNHSAMDWSLVKKPNSLVLC